MEIKESYKSVEMDVITFSSTDVIVTSDNDNNELQDELIGSRT